MKSFFWKQPYGSLMLHGKIETRTWETKQRGEILICTSLKPYAVNLLNNPVFDISGSRQCDRIGEALRNDVTKDLNGYAIAVGQLIDCRPMAPEDEDKCFVEYYPDLWCHVYQNVRAVVPFPYKGHLSFRPVPADVIAQIQYK